MLSYIPNYGATMNIDLITYELVILILSLLVRSLIQ